MNDYGIIYYLVTIALIINTSHCARFHFRASSASRTVQLFIESASIKRAYYVSELISFLSVIVKVTLSLLLVILCYFDIGNYLLYILIAYISSTVIRQKLVSLTSNYLIPSAGNK